MITIVPHSEDEWLREEHAENMKALNEMRSFIPIDIASITVKDLQQKVDQ